MKLDDSVKFEAETLRTMAFVAGTPLVFFLLLSGIGFVHFLNMAYNKACLLVQRGGVNHG